MLNTMKQKNNLSANRIENRRKKSPVKAFVITLAVVLGVGFFCMLLFSHVVSLGTAKTGAEAVADAEDEPPVLFWEILPQKEKEKEEVVTEQSKYGQLLADEAFMAENNIYAVSAKDEDVVTIGFAGDILFDDEYAMLATLLNRGVTIENGISQELLAQMQDVDIMMVNNEFPFTDRGTPVEGKAYTFRADTDTVHYLQDMGVDVVSLANNHAYDFGETGLLDTFDTLENAGIPYVGAGRNIEEASAPVYFIANDIKIAIVSATQIERLDNPDTKGATENRGGVFRCWNPEKLYEAVAKAKETSDFVIVFIHWGTENQVEPDWAQLEQAPALAQAGADLIIGAHSHCLQGIQYFDDTPVVYSLGNFWFNSKSLDTCMIQAEISGEGLKSLKFIPAIQSDCRTTLAPDGEKERIISYMESISYDVDIDEEGNVKKR